MHLEEKLHLLARQVQGGGDLFGALAVAVHAQGVGAFVQVESRFGKPGRLRYGRVLLQVVKLRGQCVHGIAERL